jgi:hypothetical protein
VDVLHVGIAPWTCLPLTYVGNAGVHCVLTLLLATCHWSGINFCMHQLLDARESLHMSCTQHVAIHARLLLVGGGACDKHRRQPCLHLIAPIIVCVCLAAGYKVNSTEYALFIHRSKEIDTCFDGVELVEDRYIGSMTWANKRFRCNERGACVGRK